MTAFVSACRRRIALAGFVVFVLAPFTNPTLAGSVGLDPWNVAEAEATIARSHEVARELDAESTHLVQRMQVKEAIIADLLAGRRNLAETTDEFLTLNGSSPMYMEIVRSSYPGVSDREKVARNVIAYASLRVADRREKRAVCRRLEAELNELVRAEPYPAL